MKKILLVFLLFLSFSSFASNWILVSTNKNDTKYIVDKDNIEWISKTKVMFWLMTDESKVTEFGHLSSKSKEIIDCVQRESAIRYVVLYSENSGKGKILKSFKSDSDFDAIVPDTSMDEVRQFVCKKI